MADARPHEYMVRLSSGSGKGKKQNKPKPIKCLQHKHKEQSLKTAKAKAKSVTQLKQQSPKIGKAKPGEVATDDASLAQRQVEVQR